MYYTTDIEQGRFYPNIDVLFEESQKRTGRANSVSPVW